MSQFDRYLPERGLLGLEEMARSTAANWWQDLLARWAPSGSGAGLRLAIRDGYLNFYGYGQSVARVGFGRGGTPFAETHLKYIGRGADTNVRKGKEYARLEGATIRCPGLVEALAYEGGATLDGWIARAQEWRGDEKVAVDTIVANDASVIDLEMGLPRWDTWTGAKRMDLVALEQRNGRPTVVFWEAKLIEDNRIVSRADVPHVITDQIIPYHQYLTQAAHAERVRAAYRRTCELLVRLHAMASEVTPVGPLDPLVREVAQTGDIYIDPMPRLVIFGDERCARWQEHGSKLTSKVGCLVLSQEPYTLRYVEAWA